MELKVRYPHLHLKEWPFHVVWHESLYPIIADRSQLNANIATLLRDLSRRPTSSMHLMWAWFGAGKTHSIKHMLNNYRAKVRLATAELEYDVTIRTFTQLYQALMSRLDFETISEWSNPPTKGSWHDFESFIGGIKSEDYEEKTTAVRWLTGEEKSKKALSRIGIRSPIRNVDTAIRAFSELTRLGGKNNSAVTLFIDEFQHVAKLNKNWQESILNGLTKLVNSSPRHFCLIISFRLRMPMKILSIIPDSMTSRFSGDPFIEVGNFSRDEAEEFMKCLFRKFRVHEVEDPYFPYTPESFEAILQTLKERRVEYNPRSLMKIFGHISERFEDSVQNPPISEEFVKVSLWTYRA